VNATPNLRRGRCAPVPVPVCASAMYQKSAKSSETLLPYLSKEGGSLRLPTCQRRVAVALCGAIFGGGSFVWQTPVLLDDAIRVSLELTEEEMVECDSLIFVAWAIGAIVLGNAADRGRKPVCLGSIALIILHLIGCACSAGVVSLCFWRFVGGFALGGSAAGFMLGVEHADPSSKAATATQLNIYNHAGCYAILGLIHLGCVAVHASWRVEMLAFAAVLGMLTLLTALLVPESPVLRLAHSKSSGASEDSAGRGDSIDSLFRGPLRGATAVMVVSMVTSGLIYYSLAFEAGAISDHLLLNVVLLSLSDIPGLFLSSWLCGRDGADTPSSARLLLIATAVLLTGVAIAASLGYSIVLLAFAGKMATAGAIQLIYLLPSEFFPPKSRATVFGVASACCRVACAAIPGIAKFLTPAASFTRAAVLALVAAFAMERLRPTGRVVAQ
jgi:hypothetical protein